MTSPYARPDEQVLGELERLLGHLTDELSSWRRRCQKAETDLQAARASGGISRGDDIIRVRGRMLELERDNVDLRARVDRARELVEQLQQRLSFLEDNQQAEAVR